MLGSSAERASCENPDAARRSSCAESVARLFCNARLIASESDNCAGAAEVFAAPGRFCLISDEGSKVDDGRLPVVGVVRTSGIALFESGFCAGTVCCAFVAVSDRQKSGIKKPLKAEKSNLPRLRLRPLDRPILTHLYRIKLQFLRVENVSYQPGGGRSILPCPHGLAKWTQLILSPRAKRK